MKWRILLSVCLAPSLIGESKFWSSDENWTNHRPRISTSIDFLTTERVVLIIDVHFNLFHLHVVLLKNKCLPNFETMWNKSLYIAIQLWATHINIWCRTDSKILMQIRFSLIASNTLTFPDKEEQRKPCQEIYRSQRSPGSTKTSLMSERKRIEPKCKRKYETKQIDNGCHFCSLWFVAVTTVRVCYRCACLNTNRCYSLAHRKSYPLLLILDANTVND